MDNFLAVNIGNTNTSMGVFSSGKLLRAVTLPTTAGARRVRKALRALRADRAGSAGIASVVPRADGRFAQLIRETSGVKPVFLRHSNSGLRTGYARPESLGADRIANAVAGYGMHGGPLVVADFGTAVTLDCIGRKGEYLGGVIMPGAGICAKALSDHTGKLPLVEPSGPRKVLGRSTKECIASGLWHGSAGAVERALGLLLSGLGRGAKAVATGGAAGYYAGRVKGLGKTVPHLTLYGIYFICLKRCQTPTN